MNKENLFLKIINQTLSDNSYLGDDCAYLKDFDMAVSQDALVEDVHFSLKYFTPYEIGKKSVLVNLSDIVSSGADAKYLTISLSGKLNEEFIEGFYKGANEICKKYNLKIVGGDLTGGDKICISICIFGAVNEKKVSKRKNAHPGDLVFLKGFCGHSAAGLEILLKNNTSFDKSLHKEFIQAHKTPVLYPEFASNIARCAKFPFVMTDTSDGLYDSLERVSKASNAGFEIEYSKIPTKLKDKNLVLFGGEDYGLLICLNPKDAYLAENSAQIGTVVSEKQILIDNKSCENLSYDHFS